MKTKNEIRLLLLLGLVVLGMGNYYGYKWLSQKSTALALTEKKLRADKAEAEVELKRQGEWEKKKAWIAEHEPPLGEADAAGAKVLEVLLKGAREQHLEIVTQSLKGAQSSPAGTQVSVQLKIKGPMQGICKWLSDLQKPENFYAVTLFSLQADQDQKSMVCTLQMARYFKGGP